MGMLIFGLLLIKNILKLGAFRSIPTEMKARPGRAASKFREHTRAKNLKERQKNIDETKSSAFRLQIWTPRFTIPIPSMGLVYLPIYT